MNELRRAIHAGQFARALEMLPARAAALSAQLAALPSQSPEALRLAAEAGEFFRSARADVLCARAHCAARLEELARLDPYRPSGSPRRTWELRG